MKQFLFAACLLAFFSVQAQDNHVDRVQIGDQLVLGAPSGSHYKHVDVPRKNFIIKRGGIANLSALVNESVTITDISYGKTSLVTFKRTDGKKFFRVYKTLTARLNEAVDAGEVKIPDGTNMLP
ncbi:hypothetical protein [Flagellimonas nanhaiensis]|uniref:DUF4138 domain-containing protein n=1 Tax=Flagellimonas nanhaiensis TaxID=2292706 RepID=A0A371JPW4_9FLAO|nr:hypothetical protein [Allomuricauda nanhaiensis]RDY59521.1 hypothetical protein DX873_09080 [Allomuricauda nanhaiensis]